MKLSFFPLIRVGLIVVLSAALLWFLYGAVLYVGRVSAGGMSDYGEVLKLALFVAFTLAIAAVPGIMLYSLVTKRLYGFAASVWLLVTMAVFYALVTLPSRVGFFAWVSGAGVEPGLIKSLLLIVLSAGCLVVPYVVFIRMMRLIDKWLYPKVFKPLEGKI